jgi:putative transposase
MKRKKFSEEQIIKILKEHEAGSTVVDIARRHGIAENTIYRWKAKYGGLEVSEAKRLRALEHENARLKKLLVEAELDKAMLKDVLGKSGEAGATARGGRLSDRCIRRERATGVPLYRVSALDASLSLPNNT